MYADELDRTPAHERLLTREQVDALDDLESLEALQDDVMAAAKQIEVDLEFRSDDGADAFWEQRARRALSAHYTCNGHLTRRIKFLRRGGKTHKQEASKAARKEAAAQLLAQQAVQQQIKLVKQREVTIQQMIAFADRQSLLAHFHKVAGEHLDKQTMLALMSRAHSSLQAASKAELDAQRIEARSDETLQAAQPEGREPDGEADAPDPPLHPPSSNQGPHP